MNVRNLVGKRVIHKEYGYGRVTDIDDGNIIVVFDRKDYYNERSLQHTSVTIVQFEPPHDVKGTPVEALMNSKKPYQGEEWVTLIPLGEEDPRLWEFSLTSGRVIQKKFE
jgi:hypothetical protein